MNEALMKIEFANIDAEQSLIGLVLINPRYLGKIPDLKAEEFFEPVHQRIYAEILKAHYLGRISTPITLKAIFDRDPALKDIGGAKYLMQLAQMAVQIIDIKDIERTIKELAARRKLNSVCENVLVSAEMNPIELIKTIHHSIREITEDNAQGEIVSSKQIASEILDSFKEEPEIYSTGLPCLDKTMFGGLIIQKSYGMVGPRKGGKSAMILTIAANLANTGLPTTYVALEMGSQQLMHRVIARKIEENPVSFLTGRRNSPEFQDKVANFWRHDNGMLRFINRPGISFPDLKWSMRNAIDRFNTKVFIIDYLQLIGGMRKGQNKVEHLDEVSQWIAEFTKENNVISLTASQANQDGNTRYGEGIRMAFDQVYMIKKCDNGSDFNDVWLDMMDTRYTPFINCGSDMNPALRLNPKGVFFEDVSSQVSQEQF